MMHPFKGARPQNPDHHSGVALIRLLLPAGGQVQQRTMLLLSAPRGCEDKRGDAGRLGDAAGVAGRGGRIGFELGVAGSARLALALGRQLAPVFKATAPESAANSPI